MAMNVQLYVNNTTTGNDRMEKQMERQEMAELRSSLEHLTELTQVGFSGQVRNWDHKQPRS